MAKKKKDNVFLLDASALIATIGNEPGAQQVDELLDRGLAISSVNLTESYTKLQNYEYTLDELQFTVEEMGLRVIPFMENHALAASHLHPFIKSHNLSLADRACLAVAMEEGYTILTTDRIWAKLPFEVSIKLIR